jgi:hypothetical protein
VERYRTCLTTSSLLVSVSCAHSRDRFASFTYTNVVLLLLLFEERAYFYLNDHLNASMPPSLCALRDEGALTDLWSGCTDGYQCKCCTVCCDWIGECINVNVDSKKR